jgi:hypothetical protein
MYIYIYRERERERALESDSNTPFRLPAVTIKKKQGKKTQKTASIHP